MPTHTKVNQNVPENQQIFHMLFAQVSRLLLRALVCTSVACACACTCVYVCYVQSLGVRIGGDYGCVDRILRVCECRSWGLLLLHPYYILLTCECGIKTRRYNNRKATSLVKGGESIGNVFAVYPVGCFRLGNIRVFFSFQSESDHKLNPTKIQRSKLFDDTCRYIKIE